MVIHSFDFGKKEQNEETFELADGYRLKAFRVNHGILCYGYTLELDRAGKFQLQKAMEQEIPKQYWSRLQKGEVIEDGGRVLTPDMVLGPQRKGIKLTYCTDTRPVPVIAECGKQADLFIWGGMYPEKE